MRHFIVWKHGRQVGGVSVLLKATARWDAVAALSMFPGPELFRNDGICWTMACSHYDYVWPKALTSGVMFFYGQRITIEEFTEQAKLFR